MSSLAFKNTDIGRIPSDWEVKKLGEVGSVKMCKRIFKHETSSNGDIPFFKIGTFGQIADSFISQEKFEAFKSLYPYPRKGTPLISAAGTIGRIVMHNGQDAYYQDSNIVWLEHDEREVLNPYLRYYYNVIKWVTETGSAITRLYNSQLLSALIAVPSIEEQRAIATALSDMDALIEAKSVLLEKKRAIKQGAMQELLTGSRRLPGFPVTPMKKTDIGEIPEDWKVCKMGENGTFLTAASYTRSELSQYGDVACIHYGDIHTKYKTWLSLNREEVPHIDYSKVKNYPYLRDGDLIIADASEDYAGLSDWVELTDCQDKKCIGGLHTIVFRPIEDIFAFGYLGLISSLVVVKKQLISKTVGTKVYSLTASMLKDLLFPLPSTKEEQAAIHNIIWCMDNEVKAIEAEINKLRDLKQGMMQELLTGRIRLVK